jgi:glycosyltransferase involved in cell wall biosynthesis
MDRRVVFLSWSPSEITGGIKFTFRCAEVLQGNGITAVVATERAERPQWFESSATIIDLSHICPDEDILVFPENHRGWLEHFSRLQNPKIVLCQNPYGVCRGLGSQEAYSDFGVTHILSTGAHATRFCRRRFIDATVIDVLCFIDHKLFAPPREKRLQIALIPKKRPLEATFIQDLVRHTGIARIKDIPWIAIENMTETQVARVMRDSAIFLSLSRLEAYAFNILEAMSSGCLVAGFTGIGAREYTTDANGFFVPEDDCMACADALRDAIQCAIKGGRPYQDLVNESVSTGMRYSRNRFVQRFIDAWKQVAADLQLDIGISASA